MIVNLDGVRHEFPDDATDDEIRTALDAASPAAPAPRQPDWREQALGALPGAGATVGAGLGGVLGAAGGPPGVAGGLLLGAGMGGYSGRNLEQYGRSLMGLPQAQANVMGAPIPQGLDLPAAALGHASGEAAMMGPAAALGPISRLPPRARKALAKFVLRGIPGVGQAMDAGELAVELAGKASKVGGRMAKSAEGKIAGSIRPRIPRPSGEPPKAPFKPRGASRPELARRAERLNRGRQTPLVEPPALPTRTPRPPDEPTDLTQLLQSSLDTEVALKNLGASPAQRAAIRKMLSKSRAQQ